MMPSSRRVRVAVLASIVVLVVFFYLSNDASSKEFYSRTVTALDQKGKLDNGASRKLREAQVDAVAHKSDLSLGGISGQQPIGDISEKDYHKADSKTPKDMPTDKPSQMKAPSDNRPSEDKFDAEKSVAGRKTMQKGDSKKPKPDTESLSEPSKDAKSDQDAKPTTEDSPESKEAHELELEINSILKRSPIIIFSKTYCPHSKKAKAVLNKYNVVPAPFIVELDEHPLGSKMQDTLEKMTGRRTVPNILVNGKSIGGGDDIVALDAESRLEEKIKEMGGKRIMEVNKKDGGA